MVERFNRTIKSMLCKRVAQFGAQWDKDLSAIFWTYMYHNMPHESTSEKPSFCCLAGIACLLPKLHSYLLKKLPQRLFSIIVKNWWWTFPLPENLLWKTSVICRSGTRSTTIRRLMSPSTRLETGCWFIFRVRRRENKGNCHTLAWSLQNHFLQWYRCYGGEDLLFLWTCYPSTPGQYQTLSWRIYGWLHVLLVWQ